MNFVFHHGGGQGGWIWAETMAAMAAQAPGQHTYTALDVPGCGTRRGRDTTDLPFAAIADELLADIEGQGLSDVVLIGHSQGGTVMARLAALRPELFRRLVFVSCVAPDAGQTVVDAPMEIHGTGKTSLSGVFGNPDVPVIEQYRAMFCNDMDEAQAEAFLANLGEDQWPASSYAQDQWQYDHLADIPVSYVVCLQDAILTPPAQEVYAARYHARRLHRIDTGHQPMNTRPHGLAEILLADAA